MITIEQIMEHLSEVTYSYYQSENGGKYEFAQYMEDKAELRTMIEQYRKEAVPDGWQLVPIEPTDEMIRAGNNAMSSHYTNLHTVCGCYQQMLSAAPKPKE